MKDSTWHFTATSQTQAMADGPPGSLPASQRHTAETETTNRLVFGNAEAWGVEVNGTWFGLICEKCH